MGTFLGTDFPWFLNFWAGKLLNQGIIHQWTVDIFKVFILLSWMIVMIQTIRFLHECANWIGLAGNWDNIFGKVWLMISVDKCNDLLRERLFWDNIEKGLLFLSWFLFWITWFIGSFMFFKKLIWNRIRCLGCELSISKVYFNWRYFWSCLISWLNKTVESFVLRQQWMGIRPWEDWGF